MGCKTTERNHPGIPAKGGVCTDAVSDEGQRVGGSF
jgi:hypothetical protein